jgi:RHS repeat-associated protein
VYRVHHTYDLANNRRTAEEVWNADASATPGSAWVHKATSYDYDDLYQLTEEAYTLADQTSGTLVNSSATDSWTYDKAGNRLTQVHTPGTPGAGPAVTTTYTYHPTSNELLSYTDGTSTTSYTYDLAGNPTQKAVAPSGGGGAPAVTTDYTYDTHHRLTGADLDGADLFDATYDYRTRRLSKTKFNAASGGIADTTLFRYDAGTSFQELDTTYTIDIEFTRGAGMGGGIGSILYAIDNGTAEYFTYNAVGHTTALTDAAGGVQQTNAYSAFGDTLIQAGPSTNNRLTNTKERDASLGLDNHGFRYYDPQTGRYLTRDPAGYVDGPNLYKHVHNNPVNQVDPVGLQVSRRIAEQMADRTRRVGVAPKVGARVAVTDSSGNLRTYRVDIDADGGRQVWVVRRDGTESRITSRGPVVQRVLEAHSETYVRGLANVNQNEARAHVNAHLNADTHANQTSTNLHQARESTRPATAGRQRGVMGSRASRGLTIGSTALAGQDFLTDPNAESGFNLAVNSASAAAAHGSIFLQKIDKLFLVASTPSNLQTIWAGVRESRGLVEDLDNAATLRDNVAEVGREIAAQRREDEVQRQAIGTLDDINGRTSAELVRELYGGFD